MFNVGNHDLNCGSILNKITDSISSYLMRNLFISVCRAGMIMLVMVNQPERYKEIKPANILFA